ncbi:hypothetical protein [Streptomyces sp. NPDC127197]|uniref:hypothetical protein n=1 Tax=Streptomyces sp. NPDC127197 TaxID=3345388 RepID=UPI003635190C
MIQRAADVLFDVPDDAYYSSAVSPSICATTRTSSGPTEDAAQAMTHSGFRHLMVLDRPEPVS